MALQDITITSSIKSLPTLSYGQKTYIASTDDQSFPLEIFSGSYASWPTFVQDENYTNNLIVNITQSWSGSNITPLGAVPFFHNTMEEFVNGEFSGSSIEVSDGSLLDPYCEQFLIPSTTPVDYSIFPFFKVTDDFYPSFFNLNTVPNNGQIYIAFDNTVGSQANGQYAKIAKIDDLGHDNTLTLRELKKFSYIDTNAGKVIFYVTNLAEFPEYVYYEITTEYTTANAPFDDNYFNFTLSASYTGSLPSFTSFPGNPLSSSYGSWTIINNPLNNLNTTTGSYTFTDTPNIKIFYTSSINITPPGGLNTSVTYRLFLYDSLSLTSTLLTSSTAASTTPFTITLSGSSPNFTKNNILYPSYTSNRNNTVVTASFIVTQSVVPQSSTSSFNLEPYLISNFNNTDCDVLMNNASTNRFSKTYRRVLYDTGYIIPSNFEQIISGTAEFAEITDYNYNATANVRSRYDGVRTTSPGFNLPSVTGFSDEVLSELDSNSLTFTNTSIPNVNQTTTYFAYFTSLKSNNPIFKGTTSPVLKYLIREDGKLFPPTTDDIAYYNIVGSFEKGKKALTSLLNDTTVIFTNTHSILLSGESYTPILYTISASNTDIASYTSTIDFVNLQNISQNIGTPVTYSLNAANSSTALILTNEGEYYNLLRNGLNFLYDPNGYWVDTYSSPNVYEPYYEFQGIPNVEVELLASIDSAYYNGTVVTYQLEIWKKNGSVSSSLGAKQYGPFTSYGFGGTGWNPIPVLNDLIINFVPQIGDTVYAVVKRIGGGPAGGANTSDRVATVLLRITTLGVAANAVTNFWTTGSSSKNILTCSLDLSEKIFGNYRQIDIPSSGFDPIQLPCDIQTKDEIRFEYNEDYTFKVTEVTPSGSQIYLTLDRDIPTLSTLNINHFTVRRKVKDAITGISLNALLVSPIYEGFLYPEYPSETIQRDASTIITDLSERNLI